MGLLDSVIGALGQGGGGGQGDLLSAVVSMLAQGGGGGLGDILGKLQQAGLGDQVSSWVSTGANLPVSPDALGNALGPDILGKLGQHSGLQGGDLLGQLAQVLPQVVDHLTPQGQMPQAGGLDVGAILGQLMRR